MTGASMIRVSVFLHLAGMASSDKYSDRVVVGPKASIDAGVLDIRWLGPKRDTIICLTYHGTLWRSQDDGRNWTHITDKLPGNHTARRIRGMIPGKTVDNNVLVALGVDQTDGWVTENAGLTWRRLSLEAGPAKAVYWIFHRQNSNWALVSHWTAPCQRSLNIQAAGGDGKLCSQELYITTDLGKTFRLVARHVVQYSWGSHEHGHDNRVFFTSYRNQKTDQVKLTHWTKGVDFRYTDDFGKTATTLLSDGNKFQVAGAYTLVVTVSDESHGHVRLMVSSDGGVSFRLAELPHELQERSYVLLDTSEDSVVLHVDHGLEVGDLYVSDPTGVMYALSLPANVRNRGICAFEKMYNLQGIYLANVRASVTTAYIKSASSASQPFDVEDSSVDSQVDQMIVSRYLHEVFDPEERSPGHRRLQHRRLGGEGRRLATPPNQDVKTVISFDAGGEWGYMAPPKEDAAGNLVPCHAESKGGRCSLHLHDWADLDRFAPFYSWANALGIVMGSGNVGEKLTSDQHQANTYLSRDGGLTWMEARKGVYIFEFGNLGGLLVMADMVNKTNKIVFSWNEGITWHEKQFTDTPIRVINIIIEPTAKATKFLVYGTDGPKGILIHLDMSHVHETLCKGPERAGDAGSDYELWSPSDGESQKCLAGVQRTYVRRKQTRECLNDQNFTRPASGPLKTPCKCTQESYQCAAGFHREIGSLSCIPDDLDASLAFWCKTKRAYETITISTHRKVPGDGCVGGWSPKAEVFQCTEKKQSTTPRKMPIEAILFTGALVVSAVLLVTCVTTPGQFRDALARVTKYFTQAPKARRIPRWSNPRFRGSGSGRYRAPAANQPAPDAEMVGMSAAPPPLSI